MYLYFCTSPSLQPRAAHGAALRCEWVLEGTSSASYVWRVVRIQRVRRWRFVRRRSWSACTTGEALSVRRPVGHGAYCAQPLLRKKVSQCSGMWLAACAWRLTSLALSRRVQHISQSVSSFSLRYPQKKHCHSSGANHNGPRYLPSLRRAVICLLLDGVPPFLVWEGIRRIHRHV